MSATWLCAPSAQLMGDGKTLIVYGTGAKTVLRVTKNAGTFTQGDFDNITNFVVMNTTANALLAIGASPVMAHAVEEVEEMAGVQGRLRNLGFAIITFSNQSGVGRGYFTNAGNTTASYFVKVVGDAAQAT